MSDAKGLLLVTMEPPPALEEEFNDWYDNEHLPERAAIPGVESAIRCVCVAGWPRYVALYDLSTLAVLDGPGYTAVSGDRFSPWTKRVLGKVHGQYRVAGTQCYPGTAVTGSFARMLMLRIRDAPESAEPALVQAARETFESRPSVTRLRVYRNTAASGHDFIVLVESLEPLGVDSFSARAFGPLARHLDIVNEYVRYWKRGALTGVFPAQPSH